MVKYYDIARAASLLVEQWDNTTTFGGKYCKLVTFKYILKSPFSLLNGQCLQNLRLWTVGKWVNEETR